MYHRSGRPGRAAAGAGAAARYAAAAMRLASALLVCALLGCGPSPAVRHARGLLDRGDYAGAAAYAEAELGRAPRDGALWRVRIRAALGLYDADEAVALYRRWRELRGADDPAAIRMMASTTLWQALASPSAEVRREAIAIVERLELEPLAEAVADRMADDDDAVAAAAAVAVLTAYPQAPLLATELLASADPVARAICVAGIGRKVGARAADDLRPLAGDPDPRVRRAVIDALAPLRAAVDGPRLLALAADDDAGVRADALRALARARGVDDAAATARGRAALADDDLGVRLAAVELLGARRDAAALAAALDADDLAVAAHAARALRRAGAADAAAERALAGRAAAALDRALADPAWHVRAGALNLAASVLGAEAARARHAAALADPAPEVRLAAARLLRDDPRAVAVLDALLAEPATAAGAAAALARRGEARGLAALDALAVDADAQRRRAALAGYAEARRLSIGAVAALADPAPGQRLAAAALLLELVDD